MENPYASPDESSQPLNAGTSQADNRWRTVILSGLALHFFSLVLLGLMAFLWRRYENIATIVGTVALVCFLTSVIVMITGIAMSQGKTP